MGSVRNKVVLITGGALGIGAATAEALVAKGAKVVLVDVDQPPLDDLVTRLGAGNAVGVVADVTVFNTVRAALPSVIERKGYVLVVSSLAAFAAAPGMAAYDASKAASEHFANSLRLEVHHQGVAVGTAHMSWIDTPLVRESRADLTAFSQMIESLPGPLSKTTSVEECVTAFVSGIEKRKRHIYVPGWVGAIASARNVLNSPLGERATLKEVPRLLPLMDEEVRQLGRSTSARNI
jgi:short-subunit dehydrogenase